MTFEIRAVVLESEGVRLEPLSETHREGLRKAGDTPAIWSHMPRPAIGPDFDPWFDWSLEVCAAGSEAVWAVRTLSDNGLVGSTRYLNIVAEHRRVEVGHTWYSPAVWATQVNPACKFALLNHGFETLGLHRIELRADIRNLRSQAAIAKLGALREGVLRAHMIRRDGSLRDTVCFSVVRNEWPAIREALRMRLAALASARAKGAI